MSVKPPTFRLSSISARAKKDREGRQIRSLTDFIDRSRNATINDMSLSPQVRGYFWDINTKKASPKKHPKYYMTRILEEGNREAVNWLFRVYSKKKIKEALPTLKLSDRSANYWHLYFKLKEGSLY